MRVASTPVRATIPLAFKKKRGSRTTPVGLQSSMFRSSKRPPT